MLATILCLLFFLTVAAATLLTHDREIVSVAPAIAAPDTPRGLYRGHDASYWAGRFRARTRQLQHARRIVMSRPSVAEAINLAAAAYRVDSATLWRKARCESGLNPRAQNASEASGLFQFLPSTFASTPFGRFDIYSPYANALAAGWMHSVGRGGEWVCR